MTKIDFNPDFLKSGPEGNRTEHIDYLRRCDICGEIRHKTFFKPGLRGCWVCETTVKHVVAELAMAGKPYHDLVSNTD